uniref:PH domain-containing protein n=1 Tax=Aureoumbra lagunensis TaxID=44058 RepID=A0A7S3K2U6_9STRA
MQELGFALKRGRYKDVWRGRYFVFDEERCVLKYWESESDFKNFVPPRGELTIYGVAALEVGEKLYCISLQIGSLEEWLALHSLEERDRWIEVLRNCVTKQKKRKEEWFEPDDSLWDDVMKHPPWGYSGSSSAIEKKQVLSSTELKKLDRASVFDYSAVRSGWRVEVRYHIQAFASGLPEPWTSRISHAQLRQFLMVELGRQDLVILLDKRHAAANPKRLLSPALLGRRVELMNIVLERLVQEHSQELLDWLLQQQGESTHNDWTTTSYNALRAAAVWTKTYNNKAAAHDEKGQSESEFDTDEIISNISEDMTTKSICNKSYQKDVFLQTLQQALLTANPRYCCAGLAILVLAISIEPRMNSPAILFLAAVLGAALGAKIVHDPTGHEIRQTEDYDIVHRVQKNISLPRWPSGDGRHCFSEPDAGFFRIRGPTYLEDKLKIASKPALFPLAGVDLFLTDVPQQHVARHPAALVQRHSKLNSPRILVVNFCMPWGNLVGYWSLVSSHTNKKKKTNALKR